jgi:hypothetical protein
MLESLFSMIMEALASAAGAAIIKILGLENLFELVAALAGLAFIVIGFTIFWLGY